jgi:FkbM family methyltransferase
MLALKALQRALELLPIRGKGRLADFFFKSGKPETVECHPVRDVTIILNPNQRIERWMWAGAYERDLVRLCKKILKPGLTYLDVGANIGYFSAIAAGLVGSSGYVYAFEPIPECYARLQRNLASFRWAHAFPCAVGDSTGTATIHFSKEELGWGSMFGEGDLTREVTVPLVKLDDWVAKDGIRSLDFIKIDAEGGEYRVLQGATRILHDFRPIVAAELNSVCLRRDHHSPEDVLQHLRSAEYQVFPFNDGVLAIPKESNRTLSDLQAFTKNSFD